MNIIEAWNKAEYGHKIRFTGLKDLIWILTKKPQLNLLKMAYELGIGEDAFLADRWEVLS